MNWSAFARSDTQPMSEHPPLEWSVAARPLPGEPASGDRAFVSVAAHHALAAAVDGLGHGPEAGLASQIAVEVLERFKCEDVVSLARRCHVALRTTRGVAVSLASFASPASKMTWVGIGNVEGRLLREGGRAQETETLLVLSGVAGHELPLLAARSVDVRRGDLLILATDGIEPSFTDSVRVAESCREISDRILERHALATDDALVLVARYVGETE
jgi:negative regulator of sigma-B (phosphoserine phosphatase)